MFINNAGTKNRIISFFGSTVSSRSLLFLRHPGILGIGFSKWLTPEDKGASIRKIRSEGFPEYAIHPVGKRSVYTSIIYLEPFNKRNQRAFGYDMYSEPVRREAMDKARDENIATIAAKIILVQETGKEVRL